jgi:hypothetical protein
VRHVREQEAIYICDAEAREEDSIKEDQSIWTEEHTKAEDYHSNAYQITAHEQQL